MTPKELLLKDLCARLPHKVIVYGVFLNYNKEKNRILYEYCDRELKMTSEYLRRLATLKPYLRPLSSMTEEELKDLLAYSGLIEHEVEICKYNGGAELEFWLSEVPCKCVSKVIDWLDKKMFDYRGLIPMNLALPAKEGMYNF